MSGLFLFIELGGGRRFQKPIARDI